MKTAQKFRRRIRSLEGKLSCERCPIPKKDCDYIAKLLYGEARCLMRVVLSEILIFRAEHVEEEQRSEAER